MVPLEEALLEGEVLGVVDRVVEGESVSEGLEDPLRLAEPEREAVEQGELERLDVGQWLTVPEEQVEAEVDGEREGDTVLEGQVEGLVVVEGVDVKEGEVVTDVEGVEVMDRVGDVEEVPLPLLHREGVDEPVEEKVTDGLPD